MSLSKPYVPIETDMIMRALPAEVGYLMPAIDDLSSAKREWMRIAESWFFNGLGPDATFHTVEHIDAEVAFHHVRCILCSFEPSHEQKIAAVAVLMEAWFTSIDNWEMPPVLGRNGQRR